MQHKVFEVIETEESCYLVMSTLVEERFDCLVAYGFMIEKEV